MHLNAYRSNFYMNQYVMLNQDYNEIILYCHAKSQWSAHTLLTLSSLFVFIFCIIILND